MNKILNKKNVPLLMLGVFLLCMIIFAIILRNNDKLCYENIGACVGVIFITAAVCIGILLIFQKFNHTDTKNQ